MSILEWTITSSAIGADASQSSEKKHKHWVWLAAQSTTNGFLGALTGDESPLWMKEQFLRERLTDTFISV